MSIGGRSAVASNGPRRQSGGQWCRRRESGYPHVLKTDFFTRSFDTGWHPAYDALVDKVMSVVTDPKQMATYSTPEQIAEVVYEAATDGKDQLRYVAGADAKAMYAMRLQVGDEAFRKAINEQFFAQPRVASVERPLKGRGLRSDPANMPGKSASHFTKSTVRTELFSYGASLAGRQRR